MKMCRLLKEASNKTKQIGKYLTQFNLVAELNGWDYETKSLFLASSMVGGKRALLFERLQSRLHCECL
jgi:hypothetical protein